MRALPAWPLHVRLTLVFLAILLPLGAFTLWLAQTGAATRSLELTQRLNEPVARYMVETGRFVQAGRLHRAALADLAPHVMTVNPSVEVYLLDPEGNVVAQATEFNSIARRHVDLEPTARFLAGDVDYPLLGDNPLDEDAPRPFSVWPVQADGATLGYVYVVLGGEQYATLVETLKRSGAARDLAAMLLGALLLAGLAGAVVFFTLTRRLRQLTARVERLRAGDGVAGPRRDEIDELAHAYASLTGQLRAQCAQLEASDADRRRLVAAVSHDLRTPLTTLRGYIETLQLGEGRITPTERRRYLGIAERHAERLRARVDELFELSRLSAEGVTLDPERFSLRELAHDCLQDFAPVAAEFDITLDVRTGPGRPNDRSVAAMNRVHDDYPIDADIALIQRVLENLVDNALRHTGPGGNVAIVLSRRAADRVRLEVRDDGCGMSSETAARVFESCWTGDGSDRARGGLGLAIVARTVELHGGRVSVSSRLGRGTRFRIDLPAPAAARLNLDRLRTRRGSRRRTHLPLSESA